MVDKVKSVNIQPEERILGSIFGLESEMQLVPEDQKQALAQIAYKDFRGLLDEVLATLTPREEKVVKMRFGLTPSGESFTQAEVGSHFAVTRSRIRQIESKALRKLRHPARSRRLRDFVEEFNRVSKNPEVLSVEISDIVENVKKLSLDLIQHLKSHSDDLIKIPPDVFEHLVAELLKSHGFTEVKLVGKSFLTSADILATTIISPTGVPINVFVEVKRWKDLIGIEVIDKVHGAMLGEKEKFGWHAGMIVSIAGFKEFRKYDTHKIRMMGIELKDKNDLLTWLSGYKQGPTGLWLPSSST